MSNRTNYRLYKYMRNHNKYKKRKKYNSQSYNKLSTWESFCLWYINHKYKHATKLLRNCKYKIYLKTDHWNWTSNERKAFANGKCELCGASATATHHITYIHRGNESINELIALCNKCHMQVHNHKRASEDPSFTERTLRAIRIKKQHDANEYKFLNEKIKASEIFEVEARKILIDANNDLKIATKQVNELKKENMQQKLYIKKLEEIIKLKQ